jgi:hypothetical protein
MEEKDMNQASCPLFPYMGEPGEKKVLASKIAKIMLSFHLPGVKGPRRVSIPKHYFQRKDEDGNIEDFVLNPYETEESDIEEWFGGGEYYIQAFDLNNNYLVGRNLVFTSPTKIHTKNGRNNMNGRRSSVFSRDESDEEEDDREPSYEREESPMAEVLKMQKQMFEAAQKQTEDRVRSTEANAAVQANLATKFAESTVQQVLQSRGKDDGSSQAVIDTLRRQIDDLAKEHREEMRRRDRENEEDRTRFRGDLDRRDRENEALRKRSDEETRDLRTRNERETDDIRRRYEKDVDELKKRYEKENTFEIDRIESKYKTLEKEYNEYRDRTRKEIHELEKEALDLRKDLAEIPEEKEEKESKLPDGTPWWVGPGMQLMQQVLKPGGIAQQVAAQSPQLTQQQVMQTPPVAPPPAVVQQQAQMQAQQQAALQAQQQAQMEAQQQAAFQAQAQQQIQAQQLAAQRAALEAQRRAQAPIQAPPVSQAQVTSVEAPVPQAETPSPFRQMTAMTFGEVPQVLEEDEEEFEEDEDEGDQVEA